MIGDRKGTWPVELKIWDSLCCNGELQGGRGVGEWDGNGKDTLERSRS